MPKYCCVFSCNADYEINPNLSFHGFPTDTKRSKAWEMRICRADYTPSRSSYVCSRHFELADFSQIRNYTPVEFRKQRLKRSAVPSLNLRGAECDEREPKRQSKVSQKARSDITDNIEDITMQNTALIQGFNSTPIASCSATSSSSNTSESEQVITRLRYDLNQALVRIEELEGKVFKYENLSSEDILNYTSLNKDAFEVLLCLLNRFKPFNYWYGFEVKSVNSKNQLLISLMKLKMDIPFFDLATRFGVSRTTVTNIFLTYLHLMHETLFKGAMRTIPSLTKNKSSMPESFGDFSNCRIIIDCTEFRLSTPRRDLDAANLSYSNYKHNLTGKFLIGVAPNGAITFVSEGYPGSTSDKVVTQESKVLGHSKAGDLILADKGFLIHD
ncbi:uncharacterized protein LOC135693661 [Rhopilema esculentum]|uniref:uncharacterized protein LOC135693661 n=1 Tax=Rhopilema esculentum TaxID=499914 RepID=UPI0031E10B28|eukprot:gene11152-20037_t